MRKILLLCGVFLQLLNYSYGKPEFRLVETWQHDELIPGLLFDALIDPDGFLAAGFQKAGVKIANAEKIMDLGPYGQGPDDLDGWFTLMLYKGDLAVEGMAGKLKVFHKKGGKYTWKQTIWKRFGISYFIVSDGLFSHGKWFFSGTEDVPIGNNNFEIYFIRIYEENGKYIKSILKKIYKKSEAFPIHLLNYHLEQYKSDIFFIAEDEPLVKIISPQTLELKREVKLKMPEFYQAMPKDNYRYKKNQRNLGDIETMKLWASWKTSYSRICRAAIDNNYLVIQIRTHSKQLKRFSLLFYNADNFNLEEVVFTNDLLLAVKDGKYYLFKNGEPGYDDEAGDFVIHIHQFKDNKGDEKK